MKKEEREKAAAHEMYLLLNKFRRTFYNSDIDATAKIADKAALMIRAIDNDWPIPNEVKATPLINK